MGKNELEIVIECDQPDVEGGIVQAGERDAVSNVQSLARILAPRQYVGGDKKFANVEARDAATATKVVKNGITEVVLSPALLDGGCCFSDLRQGLFSESDSFVGINL